MRSYISQVYSASDWGKLFAYLSWEMEILQKLSILNNKCLNEI